MATLVQSDQCWFVCTMLVHILQAKNLGFSKLQFFPMYIYAYNGCRRKIVKKKTFHWTALPLRIRNFGQNDANRSRNDKSVVEAE